MSPGQGIMKLSKVLLPIAEQIPCPGEHGAKCVKEPPKRLHPTLVADGQRRSCSQVVILLIIGAAST